ncbi:LacI family DNA-binding transcriptional regulator [Bifidobacterium avesanii]|uniref:LacI family DNA-binding transcriptional regulator n=1 Tax=Bifidobacterium avesanii TaxID=1798157 RepID=A0A7K3TF37_9BIFI|nr:LacI family DNA-binding transcriptional regulator [Bifidobacterium avesanii]KAB8295628.1 transcriptional regulator, LacI family [Bifidobacterium avesanii]NEG77632.1 LacI family DNA-binding transcriptional regulator [Bifidobacterium avesanii]
MVTQQDVAREAGVSAATVSYVLKGADTISEATRRRVMDAVEKLHYTKNLSAVGLRSGRNGIIGVAVHDLGISHQTELARAISLEALKHGYQALVQQTLTARNEPELERAIIRSMVNQFCDGMIMSAGALSADELHTLSNNKPIVLLDGHFLNNAFDTIFTPCERGARMAVGHLIERGCKRVLVVGTTYRRAENDEERIRSRFRHMEGIVGALEEARLAADPNLFLGGEWNADGGYRAVREAIGRGLDFDGIYCMSDDMALGALHALHDANASGSAAGFIPVIGFDATDAGRHYTPTLSTIDTSNAEQARLSVETLIRRIEHPEDDFQPVQITVGCTLVERESTAVAVG